jgi:hypothetical protein
LIVPTLHADTILVPSGENATKFMQSLWAFVFSLSSSSLPARQKPAGFSFGQGGAILIEGFGAPESQTLIVLSHDPDTILVPSGENATDTMALLCAFVFSLNSPSAPARQAIRR